MKRLIVLPAMLVGLLASVPVWAQATNSIDLSGTWKFLKGDNVTYADPKFDDTLWKDITVPGSWQEQGNPDVTGFAWYRKHVTLPASWESQSLVKQGKVLYLDLGKIADAYEVYWNGQIIGKGGKLPAKDVPAEPATGEVHVGVPADRSNFGADNVLSVRVYDKAAPGGILAGPLALRLPVFGDYIAVEVQSKNNQREFTGPEGLPFDVVVENNSPAAWQKGTLNITLLDGTGRPVTTSPVPVDVGAGKQTRISMQLKQEDLNPGIYTVVAEAQDNGKPVSRAMRTFVYNPGGIRNQTFTTPATAKTFTDKLDAFWKTTVAAVKNTPIAGTSTLDQARSNDQVKVYKVSFNTLNNKTIYGWLAEPANGTKSPGVVVLPGYGNSSVEPPMMLAANGIAALAINVHGSDVDAKTYPSEADTYGRGGVDNPNTFVMRNMVAAGLRAVDYLAQRPEVNAEHLGIMGVSQGGGIAVDVAALDPRIKTVVANSPAADFSRMLTTGRENPIAPLVDAMSLETRSQLKQTMNYFDPVFLANRVTVPVMITIGMKDTVTPPETAYALKNAFPAGLVVSIVADESNGHGVTPGQAQASLSWLRKFLIG